MNKSAATRRSDRSSQLVGGLALVLILFACSVSIAAEISPWFATQLGSVLGYEPTHPALEGACCGGGCAVGR